MILEMNNGVKLLEEVVRTYAGVCNRHLMVDILSQDIQFLRDFLKGLVAGWLRLMLMAINYGINILPMEIVIVAREVFDRQAMVATLLQGKQIFMPLVRFT